MAWAALSSQDYGNLLLLATAIIYGRILYVTRRGSDSAAMIEVLRLVQSEASRADRRTVYEAPRDFAEWTPTQTDAAERVCAVYETVGILVKARLVPADVFIENSGRTAVRLHVIMQPFIAWRSGEFTERGGWPNYQYLVAATRKSGSFQRTEHASWLKSKGLVDASGLRA